MSAPYAQIVLHDGRILATHPDDAEEVIALIDVWQSGRKGGIDWVAPNGTVRFEYRDIARVSFVDEIPPNVGRVAVRADWQ